MNQQSGRNFKPRMLRPWSLLALIFVSLVLIGIVEYAAATLPHGPSFLDKLDSKAKAFRHNLDIRTPEDANTAQLAPRQPSAPLPLSTAPQAPPPSAFVRVRSSVVTPSSSLAHFSSTLAPNPSAFVPTRSSSVPASFAPASSAFVPIKRPLSSSITVGAPAPSVLVQTNRPTTPQPSDHSHSDKQAQNFYPWWSGVDASLGFYLATLIAALYRVLWTIIYCSFNLIEPFRALSQPNGASADLAFFSFYQSRSRFLGPIPALLKGRLALALVAFTRCLPICFLLLRLKALLLTRTGTVHHLTFPTSTTRAHPESKSTLELYAYCRHYWRLQYWWLSGWCICISLTRVTFQLVHAL